MRFNVLLLTPFEAWRSTLVRIARHHALEGHCKSLSRVHEGSPLTSTLLCFLLPLLSPPDVCEVSNSVVIPIYT